MSFYPQQSDVNLILQKHKVTYMMLELLNSNLQCIDNLTGEMISGEFQEESESVIRYSCSLQIFVKNSSFLLGNSTKIWLDKLIRVSVGYKDVRTSTIEWYNMGIYLFNESNYYYSETNNTLSLTCRDLMARLNGEMGGYYIATSLLIPAGSNIRQTMINTVTQLGKFTKYLIDDVVMVGDQSSATVPYDLKFASDDTVYSIIEKLSTLYPGYEAFFDMNGVFIFRAIPNYADDNIVLDESIMRTIIIDVSSNTNLSLIKNHIVVYGYTKDDGTIIQAEYKDENPNSPYCISKLGDFIKIISDDNIQTVDLALQRAKYECWKSTRLEETVVIKTIFVPWLGVNQKIRFYNPNTMTVLDYIVKKISKSTNEGTMIVDAIRFYPLYFF